eukprot:1820619-Karenia_brevis.AAC.1
MFCIACGVIVGGNGDSLGGVGGMSNCVCDGFWEPGCGGCVPGGSGCACGGVGCSGCGAVEDDD